MIIFNNIEILLYGLESRPIAVLDELECVRIKYIGDLQEVIIYN